MSRKRPTAEQMGSLLSEPHFRRDEKTPEDTSAQALASTPMRVDVDKIVPYDRNPRRTSNAAYEQIKESIKATGLDQVLVITQRPDTPDKSVYMIGAGGNTRLSALQELWRETGDDRFRQVWCQCRPWDSDTRTLLAHIRENDLRSDLTFIDRALAIQELRQLLEAEAGKRLSQRELRDHLKEQGYQISQTMIRWYDYTVDTLYPLIPAVLQSGLGRPQIQRIYDLQRAFSQAWAALGLGDVAEAAGLFEQSLQRHDNDVLDITALRRDLEEELATSKDCDVQRVSMEIGAALHGYKSRLDSGSEHTGSTGNPVETTADTPEGNGKSTGEAANPSAATRVQDDGGARSPKDHAGDAAKTKPPQPSGDGDGENGGQPRQTLASQPTTPPEIAATNKPELPSDIKSLRSRCWTLASRLAQGARLGDIVTPIAGGIGYLVGPVPVEVQNAMHPDIARSAICVWWQTATLAEQFARHGHACRFMPESWQHRRIGDAMRYARDSDQAFAHWQWTQADRALFTDVPGLEPNDMGPWLYQSWTDLRWADWIALVETYRELYRRTNNDPWGATLCNQRSTT